MRCAGPHGRIGVFLAAVLVVGGCDTLPLIVLGAPCSADTDCVQGLFCDTRGVFPGGLCTARCTSDAECDDGSDFPGVCSVDAGGGEGVCLRGCVGPVPNACRREGWACVPGATTAAACLPHCGQSGCPDGWRCAESGACEPGPGTRAAFETCGGTDGHCLEGLRCLTFTGTATGRCHAPCGEGSPCGTGEVCAIDVSDGTRACARACTLDGDCGAGTRCFGAAAGRRCLPVVSEGTRGPEAVCGRAAGEQCGPGLACVVRRAGRARGTCLSECVSEVDCGADLGCSVPVDGLGNVCTRPCDPSVATDCPEGGRCVLGECLPI